MLSVQYTLLIDFSDEIMGNILEQLRRYVSHNAVLRISLACK